MADRDHACHVMSSVESMRQDDFLCDFKIKVGTRTFNTHRVILAANSEYFRHLFSSNMKEVEDGCVTIPNIERIVMQQCVQFMYTSFLDFNSDSVSQILEAANFLQIKRLEDACFRFIQDELSPDNCLTVLNLARIFQNEAVEEAAETVIENNVETILASKQVLAFEKEDLRRFISFATPQTAWTAITTWSDKRDADFPDLAELVAFTVFSFQTLLNDILTNPHVEKSDAVKSDVIDAIFADPSTVKHNVDTENCFLLKQLATEENSRQIIDAFIKENFPAIIDKVEFCSLERKDLIPFLKSPEVGPEESKWNAILKWVKADTACREKDFIDLFRCLCLDKLSIEFLRETVRCEDLVKAHTDCINLLVDALLNRPSAFPQDEQPTESDSDSDLNPRTTVPRKSLIDGQQNEKGGDGDDSSVKVLRSNSWHSDSRYLIGSTDKNEVESNGRAPAQDAADRRAVGDPDRSWLSSGFATSFHRNFVRKSLFMRQDQDRNDRLEKVLDNRLRLHAELGQNSVEAGKSDAQIPHPLASQLPNKQKTEKATANSTKTEERSYIITRPLFRGIGFTVAGGTYTLTRDDPEEIRISEISPEGPATGLLRVGDVILRINRKSTSGWTHEQMVKEIKKSGRKIELTVRRTIRVREASRHRLLFDHLTKSLLPLDTMDRATSSRPAYKKKVVAAE